MKPIPVLKQITICMAVAVITTAGAVSARAQDEVGLQAIFREAILNEPPWGIRRSDFEALPESWSEWREETVSKLQKLYGFDPLTLEDQKALLAELRGQLDEVYAAFGDAEGQTLDLLVDLEGKISRRLAIYEDLVAIAETASEEQMNELRPAVAELLQALERYESDDRDVEITLNDEQPKTVPALLSEIEAAGGEAVQPLATTIRVNYYNFNVRTFISEPFADYAFYQCRLECGPVCDFILGARVTGSQRTNSGTYIDFLPCDTAAEFAVRINGNTRASTRGVTDQATIFTKGNHYFSGKKIVRFDGNEYSYYRASLGVNANNHVTGARLNNRGLIAKLIGDKIAYQKAVEKTPQTEAIAASRLRNRVLPEFNREVESTFNDVNEENRERRLRMAEEGIAPNEVLARTDDDELRIAERLMNPGQLAADRTTTVYNTPTGLTVHIHESWVNNSLAIETTDLEPGMSVPFPEFSRLLAEKFRRAFDIDKEAEPSDDTDDQVIIYDVDPLHVQFEGGIIKAILRVGLKAADRDNPIAVRRVEIPLEYVFEGDQIRLQVAENRDVYSKPLDTSDPNYRRGEDPVIADRIRNRFKERLAEETFDRFFVLKADDEEKDVPVQLASMHAVNGWMILVIEPDEGDREEVVEAEVVVEADDAEEEAEAVIEKAKVSGN